MPAVPQGNEAAKQDTAPLLTHTIRNITGVYTAAARNAIPDDKAYHLENVIPIGPGNLHVTNNVSAPLLDYTTNTIYWSQSVNLSGQDYLVNFANNGNTYIYNLSSGISTLISSALSGSGSRCCQWKNSIILFIDSNGYYAYDGITFTKITGAGVPTAGDDIAVAFGRVWIINGRLLVNSGADDYTAASWLAANGAAFVNLTDPQIRTKVQRLSVSSGLLYLYATTAINVVSNVIVPVGAVPPTPIYQNNNIQASLGTDQPLSVYPGEQASTMFANRYGVFRLYGLTAPKISEDIDGTWQFLDFSQPISGGQVVVEGIQCSAFLLKRLNDPIFGSNTVIALWFKKGDQDRWWFANFGSLTLLVSAYINNQPALFGFIGNKLVQLFGDPTTAPAVTVITKLYPFEDDVARKEAMMVGFLALFDILGTSLKLTVDTISDSRDAGVAVALSQGSWVNAFGQIGQWINGLAQVGGWAISGSFLSCGRAPGMFGHNLGLTLTSVGYHYALNFLAMDYKIRGRWT